MRQVGLWAGFLGLVLSSSMPSATAQTSQSLWLNDLDTARRIAAETNRLVLVHFWAEWCRPCRQMEAEVFSRPDVLSAIASSYVAVKLNFDQNPLLARQLNVESIPADIIMTPQGEILQKAVGGASAQRYIERLNQVAAAWQQRQALLARMGPLPGEIFGPSSAQPGGPRNMPVSPPVGGLVSSSPMSSASVPGIGYTPPNPSPSWPVQNSVPVNQYPPPGLGSVSGATPQFPMPQAPGTPQGAPNYGTDFSSPSGSSPASPWGVQNPPSPLGTTGSNPTYASGLGGQFQGPAGSGAQELAPSGAAMAGGTSVAAPMASTPFGSSGASASGPNVADYGPAVASQQSVPGALAGAPAGVSSGSGGNQPPFTPVTQREAGEASSALDIPPGNPPLGLEGYCPVSLTDKRRWVLGNRRWGVRHEGRTYLFAGPEEQRKFLANPDRYAPVLSGYDVVQLVDGTRLVEGRREHGAWFGGRVYLFADEDSFQKFSADPYRYINALPQAVARLSNQLNGEFAGNNGSRMPTTSPAAVPPGEPAAPGAPGLMGSAPVGEMPGLSPGPSPGSAPMPPTGAVSPKLPENSTAISRPIPPSPGIAATPASQPGPQIHVGLPDRIMNNLPSRVVGPSQPSYAPVATRPNAAPTYGSNGAMPQGSYPARY